VSFLEIYNTDWENYNINVGVEFDIMGFALVLDARYTKNKISIAIFICRDF